MKCLGCGDIVSKEFMKDGHCPDCNELLCVECGVISDNLDDDGTCEECLFEIARMDAECRSEAYN